MPLLSQAQIIDKYYEQIKEQYPNLSYEDIKAICKSLPAFIRENMQSQEMPIIRVKYMGTFHVHEKTILKRIAKLDARKATGDYDPEFYEARRAQLVDYLERLRNFNETVPTKSNRIGGNIDYTIIDDLNEETSNQTTEGAD